MSLAILLSTVLAASPSAESCSERYDHRLQTDLALSYEAFDQTEGQGFRELAYAGCQAEAADLIEAYIAANDATQSSLTWHIAQLRGEVGQTEAAIAAATSVLNQDEAADADFRWNDHVNAYLAFLRGDRQAFERHRAALHAGADNHPGNSINARLWDSLAADFELGYAEAIARFAASSK